MSKIKDLLIEAAERAETLRGSSKAHEQQFVIDAHNIIYQINWLLEQEGVDSAMEWDLVQARNSINNVLRRME